MLHLPFPEPPAPGQLREVAPGVLWLRAALPFRLDHVNLYLIEDGAGFALFDAGIDDAATRAMWQALFDGPLKGKRLTRLIASHCHPDHLGLAGWLCERFDLELETTQTEYLDALRYRLDPGALAGAPYRRFYLSHGLGEEGTDRLLNRGLSYLKMVAELPRTFGRLMAGETLLIGGRAFEVMTGAGHSAEQAMLYCREGGFVLCADQVLARISPNISVETIDPHGDPLGAYLRSLAGLKQDLPGQTLALPGHNLPFVGLHARIDDLSAHHRSRLDAILKAVEGVELSAFALVPVVFGRPIEDPHQMSFAFGETLAHVNYLLRRGELVIRDKAGALTVTRGQA